MYGFCIVRYGSADNSPGSGKRTKGTDFAVIGGKEELRGRANRMGKNKAFVFVGNDDEGTAGTLRIRCYGKRQLVTHRNNNKKYGVKIIRLV